MLKPFIFRKKRSKKGQATVEYVLLLVTALFILIGLRDSIFTPFNEWSKELYHPTDGYFACTLQSATLIGMPSPCGTMPSPDIQNKFGSSNGFTPSSSNLGQSSSSKGPKTNNPNGGSNDPNSQSKVASSNEEDGGDDDDSESSWGEGAVAGSEAGGGTSGDLGSSSSFPAKASFRSKNSRGKRGRRISSKRKSGIGNDLSSDAPEYIFIDEQRKSKKRKRRRAFTFQVGSSKEVEQEKEEKSNISNKTFGDKRLRKKNEKVSFEKKKPQVSHELKEEKPMNFGRWIKYILIITIVVIILTFIALQMKQVYDNLKAS